MHPDRTAHIALQDLRSAPASSSTRRPTARRGIRLALRRIVRAWVEGWTWYARQGLAPASIEPVFPFRSPVRRPARRRWAQPCPPPRFALLYGRRAASGCP